MACDTTCGGGEFPLARKLCKELSMLAISASMLSPCAFAQDTASGTNCTRMMATVSSRQEADIVKFSVVSTASIDTTVILNCEAVRSMKSSIPLPAVVSVNGFKQDLLEFEPTGGPFSYGPFHWKVEYGTFHPTPTENYAYALPYPAPAHYGVIQGAFGAFTHQRGTDNEYAIDFGMPVGSTVCAARDGTVVAMRADSNQGGSDPKFENCGNYIVIRHNDGTYAEYFHLMVNGASVQLGQQVARGAPIGRSGATGFVNGPHLHFAIFRVDKDGRHRSLPFKASLANGAVTDCQVGQIY